MIRRLYFLLILMMSLSGYAQDEDAVDQFLEELFATEGLDVEKLLQQLDSNFVYVNTSFTNQLYFSGRNYDTEQFALTPQISYYFSNGFSVSWLSNYFSASEPVWDNHSLSLYYLYRIPKSPLSIMGGVSRVFYANSLFENQTNISIGGSVDFDNYHYGASVYLNSNPATTSSMQYVGSLYSKWEFIEGEHFKLTFRPELSLLWSNYEYTQTFFRKNGMPSSTTLSDHSLVNTQLKLPLHLYSGNFDIQFSYLYNFPTTLAFEDPIENSAFFSISVGYFIQ